MLAKAGRWISWFFLSSQTPVSNAATVESLQLSLAAARITLLVSQRKAKNWTHDFECWEAIIAD
jgi:hypothetical protein